jgi:hypothetical protein
MTEDELLQQYVSVYEKITSKEDVAESAALLKPHLKTIQNPIAFYIIAHIDINNSGFGEVHKTVNLNAFIITRTDVHIVNSTFTGWPMKNAPDRHPNTGYYYSGIDMHPLRFNSQRVYKAHKKNANTLTVFHMHRFKKPLDSRLIHMFQTITKNPDIGKTTTGYMPQPFLYPTIPIGNPINNGTFQRVCRAL